MKAVGQGLLAALLALIIASGVWGADLEAQPERPLSFAELWNNVAYYQTNNERKNFASLLGRLEGKLGFNLFNSPLQLYGAYYAIGSQTSSYWNNAVYYGPGIRYKPFESFPTSSWASEWIPSLKIFCETLNSSYFKDQASGEANKRTDLRYGIDLWHEWNLDKPNLDAPWGELWLNLSQRSTNFSWTDFNGYILYFQPKVGRHLGKGIEAYIKADITTSNHDDSWLNTASTGVGLRFEPWRLSIDRDSLLKKFKMYAEFTSLSYLKSKPVDPASQVGSDFRFGVDFSLGR